MHSPMERSAAQFVLITMSERATTRLIGLSLSGLFLMMLMLNAISAYRTRRLPSTAPSAFGTWLGRNNKGRAIGATPFCFQVRFRIFLSARLQCHARESAETESTGCCRGEVDDAAAYERSPIIDSHHDTAAVAVVRHAHARAEWQRAVRSREAARLCALSACGAFAGIGVDRSDSGLRHDGGRTPNENQCAANRGGETHDHQLSSWIGPAVGRGCRWDAVRFGGGNGAIFRNQKFRKMWAKPNFGYFGTVPAPQTTGATARAKSGISAYAYSPPNSRRHKAHSSCANC